VLVPEEHWQMTEKGRPATSGMGPVRFTIHVPFSIFPLGQFRELEGLASGQWVPLPGEDKHTTVERCDDDLYILRVEGFGTRAEAEEFLDHVSVALLQISIDQDVAIQFSPRPAPTEEGAIGRNSEEARFLRTSRDQFAREAIPTWERPDGSVTDDGISASQTAILAEHQRIWERRVPMGHEVKLLDIKTLGQALARRETRVQAKKVLTDERLSLAMNTLRAANSVYNLRVRFVLLVTILEALGHYGQRPEFSQGAVASLLKCLKDMASSNDSERSQLQKLSSEVGKLKKASITEVLCDLVYRSCSHTLPDFAVRNRSDEIVKDLYSIRGNIVHDGRVTSRDEKAGRAPFIGRFEQLREAVSGVVKYRMDHPEPGAGSSS
jgi:hypothetical protein